MNDGMNEMKINRDKECRRPVFVFLFGLLMILIFVRYVLQVQFPWEILLLLAAMIALLGDRDEIIAMAICCIPLYTSLQYIYAVAICMIFYLIKFRNDLRVDGAVFPVILMLVWEWLHCFDEYSSMMGAVRALIPLVLCAFLMFCPQGRISFPFVARTLAICVAAMCMIVLSKLLVASGFNFAKAFSNMQRLGMSSQETDVVGADFNPNFLGFVCIVASTGLIQLRLSRQGKKLDLAIVVFLLLCGLLTLSRTFLLCLVLMIALFVVANTNNIMKLLKQIGAVIGLGLVLLLIMLLVFPDTIEDWVSRFQVADITSGRLALMARYHERIFENPDIYLFGMGIQSVTDKVVMRFGAGKILGTVVPHNAIQEMIFCWGIPGLLMFVIFLCAMVASAKRRNPAIRLLNYIPLILLMVKIQAGQLITTPSNVLILGFVYLSMCHSFEKSEAHSTIDVRSDLSYE